MKTSRRLDPTLHIAVIDSSILFSALILHFNYVNEQLDRPAKFVDKLDPLLQEPGGQETFMNLMRSISIKLISSHVIGELQGLVQHRLRLKGDDLSNFWEFSVELVKQWNVDERLISISELGADEHLASLISLIGPPDTGLLALAHRNSCPVITEDEKTLAREAWRIHVDCRLLKQLMPVGL